MDPVAKYSIKKMLGSGTFGNVYIVINNKTKEEFALKRIEKVGEKIPREVEVLEKVKNKNLRHSIRLEDIFFTENDQNEIFENLIFPIYETDLEKYIKDHQRKEKQIKIDKIKLYSFQIFKALSELHKQKIIHRDIKPENILIKNNQLVLCDFGCSKFYNKNKKSTPYIVSRYYRAPELCLGYSEYSYSIDIWAAGCILLEMINLKSIFRGKCDGHQFFAIQKILGGFTQKDKNIYCKILPSFKPNINKLPSYERNQSFIQQLALKLDNPEIFLDFIQKVLNYDPFKRLSADQACKHSFFDGIHSQYKKLN